MKRVAAFLLSLIVIWLQVVVSAQTLSASAVATPQCACCSGKKACCCVEEATPVSTPLAATPVSASASIDFTAVLAKVTAWTLPAAAPAIVSSADSASASSLAVPLFTRHCALLI